MHAFASSVRLAEWNLTLGGREDDAPAALVQAVGDVVQDTTPQETASDPRCGVPQPAVPVHAQRPGIERLAKAARVDQRVSFEPAEDDRSDCAADVVALAGADRDPWVRRPRAGVVGSQAPEEAVEETRIVERRALVPEPAFGVHFVKILPWHTHAGHIVPLADRGPRPAAAMTYLLASLTALALGPLLAGIARRSRLASLTLDAFVLVVLGGLVLLHILPHALAEAGWSALLVGAAAFLVTGMAERGLHRGDGAAGGAQRLGRRALFAVALLGLAFHAVVDGVALLGAEEHAHLHPGGIPDPTTDVRGVWGLAVVVHRIPLSLGLWWIVRPLLGRRAALATIAVLVAGTLIGFAGGAAFLQAASPLGIALFEAVLGGTLIHVVLHADLPPAPGGVRPVEQAMATLVGLSAGVAVVAGAGAGHGVPILGPESGRAFVGLALETAPALLAAYLAVGLMHAFVRPDWLARATRGRLLTEAWRGVAIGMPLPVCSCGVLPIYRTLVTRGSSLAAGIAFLIATPEIEIAAVLLTFRLLGPELALVRLAAAAALAMLVAVVLGAAARRGLLKVRALPTEAVEASGAADREERGGNGRPTFGARLAGALRYGFGEAVDHTITWILVGLGLSALLLPYLDPGFFAALPPGLDVPAAAILGMLPYVCASGSTPLAAVLIAKGLSPGAGIAFLLTGPATNVTTFGVLARLHGKPLAAAFTLLAAATATLLGLATNAILSGWTLEVGFAPQDHGWNPLEAACLAILSGLVLASLLRQGVREFFGQLFETPNFAEVQRGGRRVDTHPHGDASAKPLEDPRCCDSPRSNVPS